MKKLIIALVVIAVIAAAWWMFASKNATAPTTDTTNPTASNDSAQANIAAGLQGLNDTDLNAEFKTIDSDSSKL